MSLFKASDFHGKIVLEEEAEAIASIANNILSDRGEVVLSWGNHMEWHLQKFWPTYADNKSNPVKALLINIEPIEKCKHPKEKIKFECVTYFDTTSKWIGRCECGAKVKPSGFEEIK